MGLLKVKAEEVEVFAIARDIAEFPALTQDLDAELAERWAPLQLSGGDAALRAGIGPDLEIAIVAVGEEDEDDLGPVTKVIQTARDIGLKVLLVVKDVSPKSLHTLMRTGADDFCALPLPRRRAGGFDCQHARQRRGPADHAKFGRAEEPPRPDHPGLFGLPAASAPRPSPSTWRGNCRC